MKKRIFCKVKKLEESINSDIENIFIEASKKFNLTTGDISPSQSLRLDIIKHNISELLTEYISQNKY